MSWRDLRLALALIIVLSAYHTLAVWGCSALTTDLLPTLHVFP